MKPADAASQAQWQSSAWIASSGATLWELVEWRAQATPEGLFAIDEAGRELGFAALRDEALRTAAGLHALGVRSGETVSWILPTRIDAFVLMLALSRLGVVQNPLVPIYRAREVGFCLRQTGARWLLVPEHFRGFDHAEMARSLERELEGEGRSLSTLVLAQGLPSGDPAILPPLPAGARTPDSDPVRWIFYTSGTTSDPKGARHGDAAILISSAGLASALALAPGARTGVVFPVTHLGGANALASTLIAGSTQLVVEIFDPATTIPFLAAHGVTHAGAGTVFYQTYLEAQAAAGAEPIFPALRTLYGGGAPTPPGLRREAARRLGGLGVLSTYGMTECPVITMSRWDDPEQKRATTEGRPTHPETVIRIVDATGAEVARGESGDVRVRAPQQMRGFVDAALDAEAFDRDGFLCTGDVGRLDADGYLVLTGRRKDVIIRKGENISAPEIEALLIEHPDIAEVAVIGLPDAERGERCCAVVRSEDPARPIGFEALVEFLTSRQLMRQKIPEQLEFVSEMPRNASGKIVKARLRERFSNQ